MMSQERLEEMYVDLSKEFKQSLLIKEREVITVEIFKMPEEEEYPNV